MATKLGRKEMPAGHVAGDFKYMGRPARDQGDFGRDVGIADCACVNQFGEANNSKYYHGGVVQSSKTSGWFVYLEWGRIFSGKSWNGGFAGQDFQFVECSGEADARDFFNKQMTSKNTKRLERKQIGSATVWAAKAGEDGYIIQRLATRERGLPDAYGIKDNTGVVQQAPAATATPAPKARAAASTKTFHPQVVSLASALVGGVKSYTRALSAASGIVPTMDAIREVRDQYIPLALMRIKAVGDDIGRQVADAALRDVSRMVYSMVPRYIPRTGLSEEDAILSGKNVLALQQDLDAFEASLMNEDFTVAPVGQTSTVDPDSLMNAHLTWLDPRSTEGAAIIAVLLRQTNNRHGYLSGPMKVLNLFKVERPDRDTKFMANVRSVATRRGGQFSVKANLQPAARPDLTTEEARLYREANVILTQHGTRSVNITPIMQTHFRLPKSLSGVPIAGANFGHGTYSAVDYRKAVGYSSYERSAWGAGGGAIAGRGAFMFLLDTLMGNAYVAPSTGSWVQPPNGCDSVFGRGGDRGHRLENDEHVVFDPHYNRIRYLVEFTF